jgi:hypothetical protein
MTSATDTIQPVFWRREGIDGGQRSARARPRQAGDIGSAPRLWKNCGTVVDCLCETGSGKSIFGAIAAETRRLHCVDAPSMLLSLEHPERAGKIPARSTAHQRASADGNHVHRYEEVINGREYLIEVSSVGRGKWRAQIARIPGGSAALMPFYGKTPDEAAQHLSRWLALANGQRQPHA